MTLLLLIQAQGANERKSSRRTRPARFRNSDVTSPRVLGQIEPVHSYGSIIPINLAQFLSSVLTVHTFSTFPPLLPLPPFSSPLPRLRPPCRRTHSSSLSTSTSAPHSSSPPSRASIPSNFHPLTLLTHTAAAQTNLEERRTS